MPFVTLTTDWGLRDQHVAVLKGMLLRKVNDLKIIDISHDIQPFSIVQAAFVFSNAYHHFPEGTVHFIGVGSFPTANTELIAIKKDGFAFIGMNDGFFALLFPEQPVDIVAVSPSGQQFTAYDMPAIVDAIIHFNNGKNIYELGSRISALYHRLGLRPVIEVDVIRGTVIYIDEFGNAITNIDKSLFEKQCANRKFEINARRQQYVITELHNSYSEVASGHLLALFNNAGFLEIAINKGSAAALLGLKQNDNVRIDFTG